MNTKIQAIGKYAVGIPLLLVVGVLLSPLIAVVQIAQFLRRRWYSFRLRRLWPPEKFVLFAYTQSEHWAPYIETQILPKLGEAVVPIDRSEESWKRKYPIEAGAINSWAGGGTYNPIALVIRTPMRVSVFKFYEAFQQNKHGKPQELNALVQALFKTVNGVERVAT